MVHPSRLTVVQVLPALEMGGVEKGTLELARYLVAQGHRSLVVSAGGSMVTQLVAQGSEHIAWPIGRKSLVTLGLVRKLRRLLLAEEVDILHVRSRLPAWIAYLAWRHMDPLRRPHLIATAHGLYSVSRYSAIMTRAERVIAVSHTVRDYLIKNFPQVAAADIRVIPRGIDALAFPFGYRPTETWLRQWYGQYPQLRDAFVITLPGRLTRLKGHMDFIELVAHLNAAGIPLQGLIVGGEDAGRRAYAEEIRRAVAERGLANIIFTGQRDDMRDIYAVSDIVLSLSTQPESFGRCVLEALSIGVPVIGYDHGGVGEVLAALFPRGRVPLGNRQRLAELVAAWHQHRPAPAPQHTFTLDKTLSATLAVYDEVVAR